jgi:hypothetical protein
MGNDNPIISSIQSEHKEGNKLESDYSESHHSANEVQLNQSLPFGLFIFLGFAFLDI